MSFTSTYLALLTIPCTVTNYTATGSADAYGHPTFTATPTSTTCWLEQMSRYEAGADQVAVEKWRIHLSPTQTVSATSTVTVGSAVYEVEGHPWQVVNPETGQVVYTVATLRRTV